jgi:hypothetical protein
MGLPQGVFPDCVRGQVLASEQDYPPRPEAQQYPPRREPELQDLGLWTVEEKYAPCFEKEMNGSSCEQASG